MIVGDIETGHIRLEAWGENAFIIRKGKKIKIPSGELESKLIQEFQQTQDRSKLDKFKEGCPKLMDGDTVVCGKQTDIRIDTGHNKGKEKPSDDWKQNESKTVSMFPESELQVSGFEKWDKVAKVDEYEKRYHGELLKKIELKTGFFSVSYSRTDDVLVTPVALVNFGTGGNGFFDVYEDRLYSNSKGEYTNKLTKKSFVAKSDMPEEIIVTKDAIYRRGLVQMDDVFANSLQLQMYLQNNAHKMALSMMDEKAMSTQLKGMGNVAGVMEQGLGSMEMLKQMSPDDLERLMKQGEAHGAKVTPEMMKQMKELPAMMKAFEKEGFMDKMKRATATVKGMTEGMGSEGMERFAKMQAEGFEKLKKYTEQPVLAVTSDEKTVNVESFFTSPRKYKPVPAEGVKKVA